MLGFSRETLIAVTTIIEGREHLRRQQINSGSPLENPRSSSTDDVECFFSMMRDTIGQNFTTKEVKFGMRKILSQSSKRIDPDLPFTITHQVIHVIMKDPTQTLTNHLQSHPRRKEYRGESNQLPLAPGVRLCQFEEAFAIRLKFHNVPLELPRPPNGPIILHEHHMHVQLIISKYSMH